MRISDWSSDVCSSDLSIAEGVDGNILPAALGQLILGNVTVLERAQQYEAGQARTVIGENTAGGHEQSDATRAGVPNRPLPLASKRSEEHTSELQSLIRISSAVF